MRDRSRIFSLASAGQLVICVILAACSAFSQTNQGSISGKVTDQDGATVSGVVVQARNLRSSAIYKTTSSKSGDYTVDGLPAGSYQISIPVFGYDAAPQTTTVQAAQTSHLDIRVVDTSLNTLGEDRGFFAARTGSHATPNGPAPRTAQGKPDLSGVWWPPKIVEPVEPVLLPRAAVIAKEWMATNAKDLPSARCLPNVVGLLGIVDVNKVVQTSSLLVILYQIDPADYRQVFLDGRGHPKNLDPTWKGHSVGKWEGDTLVVDTIGFNDKSWITDSLPAVFPHTEMLHVVTRLRRPDLAHLEADVTFDDPRSFAKPWTLKTVSELAPGEEVEEWICNENNRDADHLVGK
jgi:hypothetical protein